VRPLTRNPRFLNLMSERSTPQFQDFCCSRGNCDSCASRNAYKSALTLAAVWRALQLNQCPHGLENVSILVPTVLCVVNVERAFCVTWQTPSLYVRTPARATMCAPSTAAQRPISRGALAHSSTATSSAAIASFTARKTLPSAT